MTKTEQLLSSLAEWKTVSELTAIFNWKPHSLRAAISGIAKSHKVERQRIEGITSYRVSE
jgi:hypothetical protein